METQQGNGFVIWLTGMNRAGKSTLAAHLATRLAAAGRHVELLDEDGAAAVLLGGLGASKEDHAKAVGRLGFVAKAVMRSGGVAIVRRALAVPRGARAAPQGGAAVRRGLRRLLDGEAAGARSAGHLQASARRRAHSRSPASTCRTSRRATPT